MLRWQSVLENQAVALRVDVDDYRMSAVYFLCEYVLRELVEHQAVYRTLDRTGAEFGVEAFVGEVAQGRRCHRQLYAAAAVPRFPRSRCG